VINLAVEVSSNGHVSLNAYSFAKLLNNQLQGPAGPGMSLFDLAEFCAQQNFDGFDVTGYYFPGYEKNGPGVPTDKYIFDLKRRAFELGLGISGTGVGNNFTVADKAARANDVQRIKNWAEVAGKLGAPVLRVFADTQMRAQTSCAPTTAADLPWALRRSATAAGTTLLPSSCLARTKRPPSKLNSMWMAASREKASLPLPAPRFPRSFASRMPPPLPTRSGSAAVSESTAPARIASAAKWMNSGSPTTRWRPRKSCS
jgi:hypothetical protein